MPIFPHSVLPAENTSVLVYQCYQHYHFVEACAVPETPQPGTGDEKSELDKPRNSNTPVNQFIRKFIIIGYQN